VLDVPDCLPLHLAIIENRSRCGEQKAYQQYPQVVLAFDKFKH
jgi:hypothetical protein